LKYSGRAPRSGTRGSEVRNPFTPTITRLILPPSGRYPQRNGLRSCRARLRFRRSCRTSRTSAARPRPESTNDGAPIDRRAAVLSKALVDALRYRNRRLTKTRVLKVEARKQSLCRQNTCSRAIWPVFSRRTNSVSRRSRIRRNSQHASSICCRRQRSCHAKHSIGDIVVSRELWIVEAVGQDVGAWLRVGRNRAESLRGSLPRMFFRDALHREYVALQRLVRVLVDRAAPGLTSLAPFYHHLQHAGRTSLGEYLLSWAASFNKHFDRLQQADDRLDLAPPPNCGRAIVRRTDQPHGQTARLQQGWKNLARAVHYRRAFSRSHALFWFRSELGLRVSPRTCVCS